MLVLWLVSCTLYTMVTSDPSSSSGYRLPSRVHYLALAPNTVRSDQTFNVIVTLYEAPYKEIQMKATLSADGEEYASGDVMFSHPATKTLLVKVPDNINPGRHRLLLEGIVNNQPVFQNATLLRFHSKRVSLFIQTDKPVYYAESKVLFRIVGTKPDMRPVHGPMTIYVKDAQGLVVRRWLQKQLNFGLYEDSFDIPYPVNIGNWSILVDGFGYIYEQKFLVKFWYLRRFDTIVNAPLKIFTSEFGLAGTVRAEHTSNKPIEGNGTLKMTVINQDGSRMPENLTKSIPYVSDVAPFMFTMKEILDTFGHDLEHKKIHIEAWIYDFYWMERHNGSSVTEVYTHSLSLKALGKKYRSFKPGSMYTVYFVVQMNDGSPYKGFFKKQIVVQRIHEGDPSDVITEEKLVIPDDHVVRYSFLPEQNDRKITVRAWHVETDSGVGAEVEFYRYWSERGRFISVTTSTVNLRVEQYAVFTVRTNFFVQNINYLVMGQGTIQLASSLTMNSVQKTFSIAVSRQMVPVARIVVYCMVDSEILADALTLHINDTRLYVADLFVNHGKDFKGDRIELIGRGIPGAFINMHGHVREFYLRGGGTFLNDEKITSDLLEYNYGDDIDLPNYQVWSVDDESWQKTVYFSNPTTGVDHNTLFNVSGLVALSDTNLTATPESTPCNESLGLGRCLNGECFDLIKKCDGFIDCPSDGFDEMACENSPKPGFRPSRIDDLHLIRKHFVRTDWVWQHDYVKHTGQSEVMVNVPNINTEFMVSAIVMHPEDGLAVVNTPIKYNLTRQFWMTVEAPTDAKKGEQLGIRCAVFNEWDQDIEAVLMLHGGEDYRFVIVEDFGIVSSYAPRTIAGDIQIMVYLEAKSSKYIHFPVLPIIGRGEVTIQISAYSSLRYERVQKTITLDYDGVINDDHFPYLIDLVNQGSIIIPDFEIPIPEQFFVPNERELKYVPGSNYITMYIWGNVVQPNFFVEPIDTDSTVGVPHDSLDGYFFEFALNLQTMQYLRTTNGLDLDVQVRMMEILKTYLAKIYAYLQEDGSFKMFRRTDKPCLWLTSIVLRHLHNAHATEWNEFLAIDREILDRMGTWIVQQFDYGKQRFEETADHVYDRNMDSVTVDINGTAQEWHLPINAHIVITLAEANWLTGTQEVLHLAAEYISSKIAYIADPYVMAIVAYALHKANHNSKDDAYYKLKRMNRTTEFVYWSQKEVPINPTKTVERRILMMPRDDHANQGHAVLATSYALMLYLAHNEIQNSVPIMKWLQTQRSNYLQFSGTQDLLVVLQALQEFAYTETNRDFYNMEITIEATQPRDETWRHVAHINSSNFAEYITFTMENAWGEIRTYAKGTGYTFIHMISFHNVEHHHQVGGPVYTPQAFFFTVEEIVGYGRNHSILNLTSCIKWNRPDLGPVAGMTVLLMVIPTGYVVPREIIEQYHLDGIPGLKRVRYRNQEVMFFFEYLTTEGVCVQIQMERWFPVANMTIQHLVNVFEYSETGVQFNTLYETYSLFHLNLCQVCGSFQCPYCPFYNLSPSLTQNLTLLWILLTMHFTRPFL